MKEPRQGRKAWRRYVFLSPLQSSLVLFRNPPGLRPGLLSSAPPGLVKEFRDGREAGVRVGSITSREGAALNTYGLKNICEAFNETVPHLRRSSLFVNLIPALRPGLFTAGPSDLKSGFETASKRPPVGAGVSD